MTEIERLLLDSLKRWEGFHIEREKLWNARLDDLTSRLKDMTARLETMNEAYANLTEVYDVLQRRIEFLSNQFGATRTQ